MSKHPLGFLILALLLVVGIVAVTACGSDEPALPTTSSDSVIAYLEEVDYQ